MSSKAQHYIMSHSNDIGFQAAHKFFGSHRSSIAETSSHNEFIAGLQNRHWWQCGSCMRLLG